MKPTLYNYQLDISSGQASAPFKELHYFQTLQAAIGKLLTHVLYPTDHSKLATAPQVQNIGVITEAGRPDPLMTVSAHPLSPDDPGRKAGVQLTYHDGTISYLSDLLGVPLTDFATFHKSRNYLRLADYRPGSPITVDTDPGIFKLQDALAAGSKERDGFQFAIREDLTDGYQGPIHRQSQTYHFENGLWALWALTHHPYLDEGNWAPFTEAINPAQMTIIGPGSVTLADSRLVAHNDPLRHLWPEAGLYLTFPAGFETYLQTHAPAIENARVLRSENNAILLAGISQDNQRLLPTAAYHDLQYQTSIQLGSLLAPPYGGYYIEYGYLPTRIPVDGQAGHPLHIIREFPDTFLQGLGQLQAKAPLIGDRTTAIKSMQDEYLITAVLYEDQKQLARLFKAAEGDRDLPPGLYLHVNRENLSPNALAKLGRFISEYQQKLPFNFLLTPLSNQGPPMPKHGTSPRTVMSAGGSHLGL